jgi:hypothetical protein
MGLLRLVLASTTTGMFVAHEMVKPNPLVWTPKLGAVVSIRGYYIDKKQPKPARLFTLSRAANIQGELFRRAIGMQLRRWCT